jgi:uncharacterized protein with HEPN domain
MALDRRPKLLVDALDAIDAARDFVGASTLEQYLGNRLLRSAVERQLEILGEACARLSREAAEQLAVRVPTARLATGLRNRIIHGYDAVDDETVFDTVTHDLPPMRAALQAWLDDIAC